MLRLDRKQQNSTKQLSFNKKLSFPYGSTGKESACNVGDLGLISGLGRSPGEGKGYPLPFWPREFQNTGVGCHFLLQCMKVKSESEVAQSCPTLSDPMDCSLPGSSAHGIFQAIVLEWIAISFSRGSSQPRARTQVSCIVDRRFTI